MKRVVIHVDRLVLQGYRPEDKQAIGLGLQQELQRAFSQRGVVLSRIGQVADAPYLKADRVNIQTGSTPRRIGQRVARAIGKGMLK
jgi:hypothetical protein